MNQKRDDYLDDFLKTDTHLVTVVVPCLNRAQYLPATLASILSQNYPKIECIVMDGGSKDGTVEVLKSYGDKIKWVSEPDKGQSDAINKGWRMGKGEILAYLNADDLWVTPDAVEKAVAYLTENPDVDMVYGECANIDKEGRLIGMRYSEIWDLEYAVEYCNHCIHQPASFIRRSALEKCGMMDLSFKQKMDHELSLRISLNGCIHYIPETLAMARNIKGVSDDPEKMMGTCIRLTKKFFTLPGVSDRLKTKKRRAISNSYLRAMNYANAEDRRDIVLRCAFLAALNDPTNIREIYRRITPYAKAKAGSDHWLRKLSFMLEAAVFPRKLLSLPSENLKIIKRWFQAPSSSARTHYPAHDDMTLSFFLRNLEGKYDQALYFGAKGAALACLLAEKGTNVTMVHPDPMKGHRPVYGNQHIHGIRRGNFLFIPFQEKSFDLIVAEGVETFGLNMKYGGKKDGLAWRFDLNRDEPEGDLKVMNCFRELLTPNGTLLFAVPLGRRFGLSNSARIYDKERLTRLLRHFEIEDECCYEFDGKHSWKKTTRQNILDLEHDNTRAEQTKPQRVIGCFALRPC